jgi:hypothetical protein
MSELLVLDHSGDTKIMWDRDNADEVKTAREHFDSLKKKGHYAYKVTGSEGTRGEIIQTFDPNLERIVMAPRPIGG